MKNMGRISSFVGQANGAQVFVEWTKDTGWRWKRWDHDGMTYGVAALDEREAHRGAMAQLRRLCLKETKSCEQEYDERVAAHCPGPGNRRHKIKIGESEDGHKET